MKPRQATLFTPTKILFYQVLALIHDSPTYCATRIMFLSTIFMLRPGFKPTTVELRRPEIFSRTLYRLSHPAAATEILLVLDKKRDRAFC